MSDTDNSLFKTIVVRVTQAPHVKRQIAVIKYLLLESHHG